MKRIFIILLLFVFCLPVLATQGRLLHSYLSIGVYYWYEPNFNIETFKISDQIKPVNTIYTVYIYDQVKNPKVFKNYLGRNIEDDASNMFDMYLMGLNNIPVGYIHHDSQETYACTFKGDEQTRYVMNPETNRLEKQMTFNNGELGIISICNPDYLPWQDV